MKSKKGFTLIELLAVVVILVLVSLLAVPAVIKMLNKNREVTYDAKMKIILKQAKQYSKDNMSILYNSNKTYLGNVCTVLTIKDLLDAGYLKEIASDGSNSNHVINPNTNEYMDEDKIVVYINSKHPTDSEGKYVGTLVATNVSPSFCYEADLYPPTYFSSTGLEETYVVPQTGVYLLEVWGAQGGVAKETYTGGYGGYSRGIVTLNQGTTLYINVGGQGNTSAGGYNGGAKGGNDTGTGGGGATSIAKVSGLLSTLSNNIDDILIVAGGGGGADGYDTGAFGGDGGGYLGSSSTKTRDERHIFSAGGSQTAGGKFYEEIPGNQYYTATSGSFGQGGPSYYKYGGGGGGGFYGGGGGSASQNYNVAGGGGSGYIGNPLLSEKVMYCFNCAISDDEDTKTVSTNCIKENAATFCAKIGSGAAQITQLSAN